MSRAPTAEAYETPEGKRWRFANAKITFSISEEELRALKRRYSNHSGSPARASDLCEEYRLTPAEFNLIRKVRGWTHDSLPFLDEDIEGAEEGALVDAHLAGLKRGLKRDMASREKRELETAAKKWWGLDEAIRETLADLELPQAEAKRTVAPVSPLAVVLMVTDLHVGARAYEEGLGDRLAEDRLKVHGYDLLQRARAAGAECAIITIGSDGTHSDGMSGGTTKGTPQDIADAPDRIAQRSLLAWVGLVDHARALGFRRVEVVTLPGNHDYYTTAVQGAAMALIYRDCADVVVHSDNAPYRVVEFGKVGLFFAHGDGRWKTRDLAEVFSVNFREEWARCDFRFALHGHFHHTVEEEGAGIRRLQIPSLAVPDAYHAKYWPVLTQPLAKALLVDKARGLRGTLESGPGWDPAAGRWATV